MVGKLEKSLRDLLEMRVFRYLVGENYWLFQPDAVTGIEALHHLPALAVTQLKIHSARRVNIVYLELHVHVLYKKRQKPGLIAFPSLHMVGLKLFPTMRLGISLVGEINVGWPWDLVIAYGYLAIVCFALCVIGK